MQDFHFIKTKFKRKVLMIMEANCFVMHKSYSNYDDKVDIQIAFGDFYMKWICLQKNCFLYLHVSETLS